MPVGTRVIDQGTGETMGDMTKHGQRLLVAKGGWHGLGNTRFKSSVNRTPRQKTNGTPGDKRELLLELMLLADVGMLDAETRVNRPLFVRYRRLNRKWRIIRLPLWCQVWVWYEWTTKRASLLPIFQD